jgi:hypothetical protein
LEARRADGNGRRPEFAVPPLDADPLGLVTDEWVDGQVVREVERVPGATWHGAFAFRIGAEYRFR